MWDKSRILDVELQRRASSSGAYSGLAQRDIKFGDRILTLDIRSTWNKKTWINHLKAKTSIYFM